MHKTKSAIYEMLRGDCSSEVKKKKKKKRIGVGWINYNEHSD